MKEDVPIVLRLSFIKSILWYKVFDRRTKRMVEEVIDGKIVLSMRALYQSKVGLTLINTGILELGFVIYSVMYTYHNMFFPFLELVLITI